MPEPEITERLLCLIEKDTDIRLAASRSAEMQQQAAHRVLEATLSAAPFFLGRILREDSAQATVDKSRFVEEVRARRGGDAEARMKAFALSLSVEQTTKIVDFLFTIVREDQAGTLTALLDVLLPKPQTKRARKPKAAKRNARKKAPKSGPPSP